MKVFLTLFIITAAFCMTASAQDVVFNFDDCSYADASGQFPDGTSTSMPDCQCGVIANGLYFDGVQDNVIFDEGLDSLLTQEFTLEFYYQLEQATNNTTILSIQNECAQDSQLSITYNPFTNELNLQAGSSLGSAQTVALPVDNTKCWHRVVITKVELLYTFYLDNEITSFVAPSTIEFAEGASLALSNSPCIINGAVDPFNGWIDELTIKRRALSSVELRDIDLQPDQIITSDTTIVQGETVDISAGPTCALSFGWTPTNSIDDPTSLDIEVTPDNTTTYSLIVNNPGGCVSSDSVTVFVLDDADMDCNNILLPNAFTPNGDLLNDTYGISNLFLVDEVEYFQVFDRWGAKAWEGNNKNARWDGNVAGSRANPGMFIYKIKYTCNGDEFVKVDNFSVLR